MFEETLVQNSKENLALLGGSGLLKDAYLAGGTALALQLGHRISVDFDFFTPKEFIPAIFSVELLKLGHFKEDQADKGTLLGEFQGVKFSLFLYQYSILYPALKYLSLDIADIRDIAAMKIEAISTRGAKRDFVDLYFICQSGFSLQQALEFYNQKYGKLASNHVHIQKSLVYFDDAESDDMPIMLRKVDWSGIKKYFKTEVKKIFAKN